MRIIVFSDNKNAQEWFSKIEKSKSFTLEIAPVNNLKKGISCIKREDLVYADFTGMTDAAIKKNIRILSSSERIFGIIMSRENHVDPAYFFHEGASDFAGKSIIKDCMTPQRIKNVFDYGSQFFIESQSETETTDQKALEEMQGYELSGSDWTSVKSGNDYIFTFMMIELDNKSDIKKRFLGKSVEIFSRELHDFLEKTFSPVGGRIWMWNDMTALFLFPFDGKKCPAIFTAFELLLNRKITSFEEFDYDILLSYKISFHIGSTTYHDRGQTGKIISDSINSIYHLSSNYAKSGSINLTENVLKYRPEEFTDKFPEYGEYEGRKIYRMLNVE